jgi:hypothetical protein
MISTPFIHNFFFQQNGMGAAAPQFGGATPNAGLSTGGSFQLPGGAQADFSLVASQGSQRSLVGESVSSTIPSGGVGVVGDNAFTPFVMSVVPIVNEWAPYPTPVKERVDRLKEAGSASYGVRPGSKAAQAAQKAPARSASMKATISAGASADVDLPSPPAAASQDGPSLSSVAELRERRAAAAEVELQAAAALAEKAKEAEAAGKLGVARIYYQQAASRAGDSPRKGEWAARAAALTTAMRSSR